MHFSIRLAVAAGLGLAASAALAQDNAALIFDATQKTDICMVADITRDIDPIANPKRCISTGNNLLPYFLVQGQNKQLRVINRKFLTNYSFFVYQITEIKNFPIEDLHAAANLTTPLSSAAAGVSKGAAPEGPGDQWSVAASLRARPDCRVDQSCNRYKSCKRDRIRLAGGQTRDGERAERYALL